MPSKDPIATLQSLELQSLDTDSLFSALTAVEQAIPVLLSCIKPILAHFSSPNPVNEDEDMNKEAKTAIGNYMDILDKIQFILRQTVYYLHETKASSNTLRPPHPNSIPTPFASTLPSSDTKASGQVELGLYGKRIEARTLKEMIEVLGRLEGVVPPDVRACIRGSGNGSQGGDASKEDITAKEGVDDDTDMEDRTPRVDV